jgi:hypothetical protein
MKNKWKRAIIFILVAIVFIIIIGFIGLNLYFDKCPSYLDTTKSPLANNFETAVSRYQTGDLSVIDFSTLTDFTWDRVYIFGPYSSSKYINNKLGRYWICSHNVETRYFGHISLIVFVENGHVVDYLHFPGLTKDSSTTFDDSEYSVDEAKFIIVIDDHGNFIWIGRQ